MNEVSNESGCGRLLDSDEGKKDKGDGKKWISLCCVESKMRTRSARKSNQK